MNREEIIRIGTAAQAFMDSEDFKTVVEAITATTFRNWAGTNPEQNTEREEFYYLLLGLNKLKATLNALSSNAKHEKHLAVLSQPKQTNNDTEL
jgi:hypothetical protein